jgi:alkylation response protein AidB-like acyl-CoA dehydrogenase
MAELALDSTAGQDDLLRELAAVVRAALAGEVGKDWRRYGELGWLSLLVPERRGGAGADERAAAVVARGMGRACRHDPYVATVMAARCLAELPASPGVDARLRPLVDGSLRAVLAWQSESGDGHEPPSPAPVRLTGGAEPRLSGTAWWVPAEDVDTYLVFADRDGVPALVVVEPAAAGVLVVPSGAADGSAWARLELRDAAATDVLASGDEVARALRTAVHTGALLCAAELLGLVDRMLELTIEYLSNRRQFGRPIGSFQVLRHRAVDMWLQQRLTDASLDSALRRFGAPNADPTARALAVSSAKARASATALRVAGEAVQLHGAIGFTEEYELGRYVNRALVLAAWLGNARAHTRRYDRLTAS